MPAPSWPRIAGNRPSGSAPERVNSSVWQMPVALISTSTSPAFGPASWTVSIVKGAPALCATAARTSMVYSLEKSNRLVLGLLAGPRDAQPLHLAIHGVAADAGGGRRGAGVC